MATAPEGLSPAEVYLDTQNQRPKTQSSEMFTMNIVFEIYM